MTAASAQNAIPSIRIVFAILPDIISESVLDQKASCAWITLLGELAAPGPSRRLGRQTRLSQRAVESIPHRMMATFRNHNESRSI
jgi:hypothetical protein